MVGCTKNVLNYPIDCYEEACSGESRADFIHKLQIALKELNETLYWLKLIKKAQLTSNLEAKALIQENKELCAIVAKSVVTAKNRSRTKSNSFIADCTIANYKFYNSCREDRLL
jgi:23S rRNA-intervening sequence protein